MHQKEIYETPILTVYGSVEKITLGSGKDFKDAWNGANTAGPSANNNNNGNTTGARLS